MQFLKKIFPIMPSLDVTNINEMPQFSLTYVAELINKNENTHATLFTYSFHFLKPKVSVTCTCLKPQNFKIT
jgi:hypothetical protein